MKKKRIKTKANDDSTLDCCYSLLHSDGTSESLKQQIINKIYTLKQVSPYCWQPADKHNKLLGAYPWVYSAVGKPNVEAYKDELKEFKYTIIWSRDHG